MVKYIVKVNFKNSDKKTVKGKKLAVYRATKLGNKARYQLQGVNHAQGRITSFKHDGDNVFYIGYTAFNGNGLQLAKNLDKSLSKMYSFKSLTVSKV